MPERKPVAELGVGALLVGLASVFVALDDPVSRLADLGVIARFSHGVLGALSTGFGTSFLALLLTALIGVVGAMAVLRAGDAPLDRSLT